MIINKTSNWRLYWGGGPLPKRAAARGVITREDGTSGALIELHTGIFVMGNAGAIRSLPQMAFICECYFECEDDSYSGDWHTHEDNPCPVHPDATMVG